MRARLATRYVSLKTHVVCEPEDMLLHLHDQLDHCVLDKLIDGIPALEVLRVACNRLEDMPSSVFTHPRLAWFAFGGNPYTQESLTSLH